MSGSNRIIDARGLACPQPVVLVKKALEEGVEGTIEVLVDNDASRENVMRFAQYSARKAEAERGAGEDIRIRIFAADVPPSSEKPAGADIEMRPAGQSDSALAGIGDQARISTIFLASDKIGHGDDTLGALLMKGFLYALAESEKKPDRIILMNGGVKLAIDGSDSLDTLRRLGNEGVDILSCGTCLDFYKLKDSLAVGRISNMYEIVNLLSTGRVLRP